MILADKIITLRKQYGWSQEELAEKMNVSRQSVSKWESAGSIPDLTKIIKLAEIFDVSTDYLLKDEIERPDATGVDTESVKLLTLEEANTYVQEKLRGAKLAAIGVMLLLCSFIPMMLMYSYAFTEDPIISSQVATGFGLLIMFLGIVGAIGFFLRSSQLAQNYSYIPEGNFELAYGVHSVFKEKAKAFEGRFVTLATVSIGLFILCPAPLILSAVLGYPNPTIFLMLALLFLMIGTGIFIMVPVSTEKDVYNQIIQEAEYAIERKETNKRYEQVATIYWPLVTAIYLGWSLWTMAWGITWILWPVAGVAFAGLVGLVKIFTRDSLS